MKGKDMTYFLCVIGMVFIIEAIPYMVFPKQVKSLARFIEKVPESTLQIIGVISALSGLVILYLGRHGGG